MNSDGGGRAAPAVEMLNIDKRFGAIHANRNVSLRVAAGSVHGLVGENGAGKTTLVNILYGFHPADRGEIRVGGATRQIRGSEDALAAGIGMVHQHFMLVETFTVLENVMLGCEGGVRLAPGLRRARREIERLKREYALDVPLDGVVAGLPVGLRQRVEILKALYRGADILILDEPTGALTPQEAEHLFRILRRLQAQGKTVILITHRLREIMAVADRVSVMRRGEMVAHLDVGDADVEHLAELMVGRRVRLGAAPHGSSPGAERLRVESLSVVDSAGVRRLDEVTLSVRGGEIVGIAGVAGNGQSELLEAIAGIRPPSAGRMFIDGVPAAGDGLDRRGQGLAHVPEDRQRMGLVMPFKACESAMLGYLDEPGYSSRFCRQLLSWKRIAADTFRKMASFDVRPPDPQLPTANLSGGNQQKLVLAREIERDPGVLLVGQPTRGVDIGAIEMIHRRLRELRDAGKAILLVSADLDEIMQLSDRILVMFDGRVVGEMSAAAAAERELGLLMSGASDAGP